MEDARRETGLSGMTDGIRALDIQKVRNIVGCPYHQPVGIDG